MLCDRGGTVVEKRGGGMTENIAIYCLKAASELNPEMCEECPLYGQTGADHCCEDALQVAIKALEELQQYRAIGTPEECRTAVEKQTARKGIREKIKKGYNRGMHHYYCPVCYEKGDLRNKYNVGLYCSGCGQKLDWGDEE